MKSDQQRQILLGIVIAGIAMLWYGIDRLLKNIV